MIKQQYFPLLRNQKRQPLNFYKIFCVSYKSETQKIINLVNDSSNEESKFPTKKWYIIDSQTTKGKYMKGDTVKFETEIIKSSLCDYSNTFILLTGNVTVTPNNNTDVASKNCAPFSTCTTDCWHLW